MPTEPTSMALPRLPKVVIAALIDSPILSFAPNVFMKSIGRWRTDNISMTQEHHFKNFREESEE